MSERKWAVDLLIVICIAGGLGIGWYCGKAQGRAEMKRWQDDYYATQRIHPKGGELGIYGPDNTLLPKGTYWLAYYAKDGELFGGWRIEQTQGPEPAPVPKPSKDVCKEGQIKVDKDGKMFICSVPKPSRGKRKPKGETQLIINGPPGGFPCQESLVGKIGNCTSYDWCKEHPNMACVMQP